MLKICWKKDGKEAKDTGIMAKMGTYMSIKFNMAKNEDLSDLTKMLIQGSTMGTIDISEKLNNYELEDERIENLGKTLLETEETNIEKLKSFL